MRACEVELARMLGEVRFVERFEQIELALAAPCRRATGRRVEIEDVRLGRADERALIKRREPAVGEVLALERRQSAGMREHHVGGQFLRLAAEAVA